MLSPDATPPFGGFFLYFKSAMKKEQLTDKMSIASALNSSRGPVLQRIAELANDPARAQYARV
jgi:hypothetical protein